MDLHSRLPETTAEERLAAYRSRGISHALLLVPFDSLSRLARDASLQMARDLGGELAGRESMRVEVEHAADPRAKLAGVWLVSMAKEPTHPVDGLYWIAEAKLWVEREEADPRLDAFSEGYHEANQALPPVRPPGRKCKCATCRRR